MMKSNQNSIEELMFAKKILELKKQLGGSKNNINDNQTKDSSSLIIAIIKAKLDLFERINSNEQIDYKVGQSTFMKLLQQHQNVPKQILQLHQISLLFFMQEIIQQKNNEISNNINEQQYRLSNRNVQIIKRLIQMNEINLNTELMKQLYNSLYLTITYIELHTKRFTKSRKNNCMAEIMLLLNFTLDFMKKYNQNINIVKFCRRIVLILIHLFIHKSNKAEKMDSQKTFFQFINLVIRNYQSKPRFLNFDTVLSLLYSSVKILLGLNEIQLNTIKILKKLYIHFNFEEAKDYTQNLIQLFFIIKILIFSKKQLKNESQIIIEQDLVSSQDEQNGQNELLYQKLSIFMNINLDNIVVELNEVARNIIRYRMASLVTLIGFKLGLNRLSKHFLEMMHDSPFNNDIQTIKLCFELFENRQFSKLQHLFQVVLSSTSGKLLNQRQVLIAMCSIFTSLYLENRQEGLLYAKLNHYQQTKNILFEQTLIQHIGFAYYNLAIHETYLINRKIYFCKALQYLHNSYKINSQNYLVSYCLSKIYINLFDYDMAYKYAILCCKSNRGRWMPFILLSCVYVCQHRFSKANIIVEELLKKYSDVALLYYAKIYLEVNKILLEVQYDQEVQAVKTIYEDVYEKFRQNKLRSKSMSGIIKYSQKYYEVSLGHPLGDFDENFLNNVQNFCQLNPADSSNRGSFYQEFKGEQILLNIIQLILEVGLLSQCESLLKILPCSATASYLKGQIYQQRQEWQQAIHEYKQILLKHPYHIDTLISLSLLYGESTQQLSKALHYIEIAGKFIENNKFTFAKGMLLSKTQRIQQAHECFIQDGQSGWVHMLPDLIYYY